METSTGVGGEYSLNKDLALSLRDLGLHVSSPGFLNVLEATFARFDRAYGVGEAMEDIASPHMMTHKEAFVRESFEAVVADHDVSELKRLLCKHAMAPSAERVAVSGHSQNWVFEMLLSMTNLNSSEDIQKRFKRLFESTAHKLRPHAPYGDYAKAVAFMLQGRDLCEQWGSPNLRRTLSEDEFRRLAWETVAECILGGFSDRGSRMASSDRVIREYLQNKSMRIISSDLNGLNAMVEHYLGDICEFAFEETDDCEVMELRDELFSHRVCPSCHTDIIKRIWKAEPLTTHFEGVSRNGKWLIKIQSAQDGNEGHKTKELAGRSRGIGIACSFGEDATNRMEWSFGMRYMPKRALVLDGDWSPRQKANLYEAGWDWLGEVSELGELRKLIAE
ncbi:hypothetical protein [uncultured Draconibacterium sp.]|uniref:hypothetical protein n=1 Tax=uncultured Draconibacterium sp. TaxID=1573823 RepID=UPI003260CD65